MWYRYQYLLLVCHTAQCIYAGKLIVCSVLHLQLASLTVEVRVEGTGKVPILALRAVD